MTLLVLEGFDTLSTISQLTTWTPVYSAAIGFSTGRHEIGKSLRIYGNGYYLQKTLSPAQTGTVYIGAAFMMTGQGAIGEVISCIDSSNQLQGHLYWNGTNMLLRTGSLTKFTSPYSFSANRWYYLEFKHLVADSGGILELRINGTLDSTWTGDTKTNSNPADIQTIRIFGDDANQTYWDDLYIASDTSGAGITVSGYLGDVRVEAIYPVSNSSPVEWTTSSGANNFATVDEPLADTSDYNYTTTSGNTDLYNMGNLITTAGTIYGISTNLYNSTVAPGTVNLSPIIKTGGTTYIRPATIPASTYTLYTTIESQNPNTSVSWTIDDINNLEYGYKRTL